MYASLAKTKRFESNECRSWNCLWHRTHLLSMKQLSVNKTPGKAREGKCQNHRILGVNFLLEYYFIPRFRDDFLRDFHCMRNYVCVRLIQSIQFNFHVLFFFVFAVSFLFFFRLLFSFSWFGLCTHTKSQRAIDGECEGARKNFFSLGQKKNKKMKGWARI